MRTRVLPTVASVTTLVAVVLLGAIAEAENFAPRGVTFHIESAPRTFARAPAVDGFVYNDSLLRLSGVRLKVEVLDVDGTAVEETFGWVFGGVGPRGRGYFLVPVKKWGTTYRVSVLSFDVISEGGA